MVQSFKENHRLLKRSLKSIPMASQTFSKSHIQFPEKTSPLFIERGYGSHVWDVDNNEFIDFISGLASISLGYCDDDVDNAVRSQMAKGVSFSLPHRLETELSEKIIALVPSAEMVRFGKNGSDATTGAIRLARAYTNKDHVAVCGYHGWHDWYIGSTTRDRGIPNCTKALTHRFNYNDIASLEAVFDKYNNNVAAVIMEPMNVEFPQNQFLEKVKSIAHRHGAVLIFDETITGFRFSLGGAQEYFNVKPDLTTLGKGIANGYPLSAIAGNKEIMQLMESVFYSFTFGGETLSLAAAKATIEKMEECHVIEKLMSNGQIIKNGVEEYIKRFNLQKYMKISGHPSWSILQFKDTECYSSYQIKTFYLKRMLQSGILIGSSHNINYSHTNDDIKSLLSNYGTVLSDLSDCIARSSLEKFLPEKLLSPIFSVR